VGQTGPTLLHACATIASCTTHAAAASTATAAAAAAVDTAADTVQQQRTAAVTILSAEAHAKGRLRIAQLLFSCVELADTPH
jgi:hypothetical protein